LTELKDEKYRRCDEISQLRRKTKEILKYLEIPHLCESEENLINDRNVSPKMANVRKLRHIHETFAKQYEDMEQQINQMRSKLNTLWNYLQVDESEQQKFEKCTQVTQTTYDRLLKELERCECLKRENIQTFVERIRKEIEIWWAKCLKSDEEKQRFTTFKSTVFTEDLLTIHEMELQDLKSFYENNAAIFDLYQDRQEMWNRKQQLECTSHDPGRYTNRGGNLLKEEKERKILSKRLPKIEAEIGTLVIAYNKRHKRPFTVHGRPIEEAIQADWERDRNLKQALLSARKKKDETPKANNATTIRTPRTAGSNLTTTRKMATSTMSVASTKYLHPSSSAKKPANITRSATTLRAGDKRKLPSPPLTMAHAKRSLLKELSNSPAFLKPGRPVTKQQTSHIAVKVASTASMKVYNAGTTTKRVS
jgi:Ase1/PRC1/MAP65 family protein